MLHSWKLVFPQMDTPLDYLSGKSFTAPVPGEFQKVLGSLPDEVYGRLDQAAQPVLAVSGSKNTGKTWLLEHLVSILAG